MFEDEYQLNIDEEKKVEKLANIYSIIRTLDFISNAFAHGKIDRQKYNSETEILTDQYKVISISDDFTLEKFIEDYNLSSYKSAIDILLGKTKRKEGKLIMDLTQKINDVNNFFYLNQSCITIGEFLPLLKELYENLEEFFEVKKFEMPELKKMCKWYELIKNRKAIEKLPEDEVKQIALDIVLAYETLKKLLQ